MESLQTINNLQIPTNKMFYDEKSEVLSIYIFDFVFIGNYKGSIKISKILDDLYKSFGDIQLKRDSIFIVDFITSSPLPEKTKLKQLKLISSQEKEKKKLEKELKKPVVREIKPLEEEKVSSKQLMEKSKKKEAIDYRRKEKEEIYDLDEVMYEEEAEEMAVLDDESYGEAERFRSYESAPPPPPVEKFMSCFRITDSVLVVPVALIQNSTEIVDQLPSPPRLSSFSVTRI